ncbi:MAG: beta-ketoacyl synthase N-terminal-like domain-containing protein, partial [Planctomycetota bacterium]
MSETFEPLSPNKQALLKIRELKQQLEKAESNSAQPIAIVSMACRFPKAADTPEKFWESRIWQEDMVGDIPDDPWDKEAFKDYDPQFTGK